MQAPPLIRGRMGEIPNKPVIPAGSTLANGIPVALLPLHLSKRTTKDGLYDDGRLTTLASPSAETDATHLISTFSI